MGQKKVDSAKARLLDLNPHLQVDIYDEALTSDNALNIFDNYDVIADGTDNFPTRLSGQRRLRDAGQSQRLRQYFPL